MIDSSHYLKLGENMTVLHSPATKSYRALMMMSLARFALFSVILFLSSAIPGLHSGTEKLTHFHFYLHSITGEPNPNDVAVAQSPTANTTNIMSFGIIAVVDNTLTEGPERSSKQIGNAQGIVVVASQTDPLVLELAVSYVFTGERYNGSSLSVLGRNPTDASIWELPILGGTGNFRLAREYALTSTYSFDSKDGFVVIEYNMYVLHH